MDLRKKLEREIEKQNGVVNELRDALVRAEAYLQAQLDMLKLLPKENGTEKVSSLRVGSDPAKVRDILREAGAPMHVSDLLSKLGRPMTRENRSALSGTLGWYVNRGSIFNRPAPNTFGLIEMQSDQTDEEQPEPPQDFGKQSAD